MAPRTLTWLKQAYDLPDPDFLYVGGAGLMHMHDESLSRDLEQNNCQ